jgi:hypothetical protein
MSFVGAKPPPCIKLGQSTYNSAQLSGPVFGEWPLRVRDGKTLIEHMFSELLQIADIP